MKKIVVFLISIFTAVGLFVGCGLTPPPANSSTSEQGSSSQASVSVSSSVSVGEESSESVEESTSSETTSSESSESVEESTSSEETSSESSESVEESTSSETTSSESASVEESSSSVSASETSTESSSASSSEEEGEIYEYSFYIGENNATEYTFTWHDDNGLYAVGAVNGEPDGIIWTTTAETIAEAMQFMEETLVGNNYNYEWKAGVGPSLAWLGPY